MQKYTHAYNVVLLNNFMHVFINCILFIVYLVLQAANCYAIQLLISDFNRSYSNLI